MDAIVIIWFKCLFRPSFSEIDESSIFTGGGGDLKSKSGGIIIGSSKTSVGLAAVLEDAASKRVNTLQRDRNNEEGSALQTALRNTLNS